MILKERREIVAVRRQKMSPRLYKLKD